MHHFVTKMCARVHISVTTWCILGYETGAFWDLLNSMDMSPGQLCCDDLTGDLVFYSNYNSSFEEWVPVY